MCVAFLLELYACSYGMELAATHNKHAYATCRLRSSDHSSRIAISYTSVEEGADKHAVDADAMEWWEGENHVERAIGNATGACLC
jgi:hypothetical protein